MGKGLASSSSSMDFFRMSGCDDRPTARVKFLPLLANYTYINLYMLFVRSTMYRQHIYRVHKPNLVNKCTYPFLAIGSELGGQDGFWNFGLEEATREEDAQG